VARSERLNGLAIANGDRLDASVIYSREDDGRVAVWCLSAAPDAAGRDAVALLLRDLAYREGGPIAIPRMHESEIDGGVLRDVGFASGGVTIGVVAEARGA
jgi:hypothetical protein